MLVAVEDNELDVGWPVLVGVGTSELVASRVVGRNVIVDAVDVSVEVEEELELEVEEDVDVLVDVEVEVDVEEGAVVDSSPLPLCTGVVVGSLVVSSSSYSSVVVRTGVVVDGAMVVGSS